MKVYTTDEKELIIEPSFKWAANPNILVGVKAYGLRPTIQVVDLQVFASPRITLKPLVPTFPCFCKILVSLMDKVRILSGHGYECPLIIDFGTLKLKVNTYSNIY